MWVVVAGAVVAGRPLWWRVPVVRVAVVVRAATRAMVAMAAVVVTAARPGVLVVTAAAVVLVVR